MAVKRWRGPWHHTHEDDGDRREHEQSLSERLAPLEETEEFRDSPQRDGGKAAGDTIRVDKNSVRMPEQFTGEDRNAASTFRLDPVVVAILALMLGFIAFVTWQITLMPEAK